MKVDVKTEGLAHLVETLQLLSTQGQRQAMAGALRQAARPMVRQAKSAYRSLGGSGALAQSVAAWQRRKGLLRGETFASIEVGPKRSNRAAVAKYYAFYRKKARTKGLVSGIRHGHLVEFGFTHRGGASIGGRGILGAAFQANSQSAVQEFGRFLGQRIDRIAAKQAAKQAATR